MKGGGIHCYTETWQDRLHGKPNRRYCKNRTKRRGNILSLGLDPYLFKRALKPMVLSMLEKCFTEGTSKNITSSQMCQDLQKKLQLEVGFLNEYGCQIASWIKDWEAIASLIQDEHQASNCDEGEQTVLKQALKSKVLSILEKKIAEIQASKAPNCVKILKRNFRWSKDFWENFMRLLWFGF